MVGYVAFDVSATFSKTSADQRRLRQLSVMRDGLFDLYQDLNASERFNASYLLTGGENYLGAYKERTATTWKRLREQEALAALLFPKDQVIQEMFHTARWRLRELDTAVSKFQKGSAESNLQHVLQAAPSQAMNRFRLSHRTTDAMLRDVVHGTSAALAAALNRSGLLLIGGACLSTLLLAYSFFRLNLSLSHSRKLLADVLIAEQRYHLLASRLQDVREEEKSLLARRVHDELGQALTAAKIDLAMALRSGDFSEQFFRRISSAMEMLDSAVLSVRRVSTELRPAVLDQLGLEPALEWLLRDFGERTGIRTSFNCPPGVSLGERADLAVFRIAQEALTNVARHSSATEVKASGKWEGEIFRFAIEDNGVGFNEHYLNDPHSIGLFGMHERAAAAGGSVQVDSQPGRGTTVITVIPCPASTTAVPKAVHA